jgi:hypothetical protein
MDVVSSHRVTWAGGSLDRISMRVRSPRDGPSNVVLTAQAILVL